MEIVGGYRASRDPTAAAQAVVQVARQVCGCGCGGCGRGCGCGCVCVFMFVCVDVCVCVTQRVLLRL